MRQVLDEANIFNFRERPLVSFSIILRLFSCNESKELSSFIQLNRKIKLINSKYYNHGLVFGFLLLFLTGFGQNRQDSIPKRQYISHGVESLDSPEIDGLLREEAWNQVAWTGNFIENQPDENTPPTQKTQFKIVYDAKNLYIAIRAFDTEPEKIERRLSRRDGFQGDFVEVNIDSYHDLRTAFSFTVTAAGVKGDEAVSNNGRNWDTSWNPVWYTKTNVDELGWTAEIRIPFSQLRFGNSREQVWGLQVMRNLFRENERSVWQRIPQDAPGWVSEFGELRGLINIKPQKQIEIQPFVLTQLDTYPQEEGNPFRDGSDFKLNGGLDGKIGITNDLTLDFTINPDFGQVEADPAAIALDGFQIFFREQRPFFVENKSIFSYRFADGQDNVFYSRRIGRQPQGSPDVDDDVSVDIPDNTKILGAAKFSGKTKNGWSIGLIESVTSREYANLDDQGNRSKELVEPLTNYFVTRIQKDFNNRNSFVGGILTATNRSLEENLDFLREKAYTGGLDFKHQWKGRTYYIEGNAVFSHVSGSKEAILQTQESLTHLFQRVDATHVRVDSSRTSLAGMGGKLEFGKAGSGNWSYEGGVLWRSPGLELNDVGFLRRADNIRQYTDVDYQTLKPFSRFRRINVSFEQFTDFDFEGNYNRLRLELVSFAHFKNNWWTEVGFVYNPINYSNSALRGGPRFRFNEEVVNWWFFGTDSRKKLRYRMGYVASSTRQDHYSVLRFEAGFTYQPFNSFNISVYPEISWNPDKTQYVSEQSFQGDSRFITAEIDNQTFSTRIRLNYTINPNLSIQYYAEPFVSKGNYSHYNYVTDATAHDLYDRVDLYDDTQISNVDGIYEIDENRDGMTDYSFDEPDFDFVQFRSNLVVRWEYIPGSEIFLVWSQGINGSGNPTDSIWNSIDKEILRQQPDNTYLIKATFRYIF